MGCRSPCGFLFLFYSECRARLCEVVALELTQESEDLVVREQSRSPIDDLRESVSGFGFADRSKDTSRAHLHDGIRNLSVRGYSVAERGR